MTTNSNTVAQINKTQSVVNFTSVKQELDRFKKDKTEIEGNAPLEHWRDKAPKMFTKEQRAYTTILFGGLTVLQDKLLEATLESLGYKVKALDCPDKTAFQFGKEYGNRGQCNPTYFTVGNLIKYLTHLRDDQGISTADIVNNYLFVTAGGCGPCRFGMYITEYRKALRDAGFEAFRVLNFDQAKGIYQGDNQESGLEMTPKFFIKLLRAVMIGDILNITGCRMRPYEQNPGSTNLALEQCKDIIAQAMRKNRSVVGALIRCRKILEKVTLNRLQVKPKVLIMGEFWATTTEGDGSYHLREFLEQEGAECILQPVFNRFLLNIWEARFNLESVMTLRKPDHTQSHSLSQNKPHKFEFANTKSKVLIKLAKISVISAFKIFAKAIGLTNYQLPNMEELAKLSKDYYPHESQGGEGHLEVAHLIESIQHKTSHLTISIKPFGCMPSSGVSDGVQSLITAKFPEANFLPVETSGDSAVNFYSRVQMALFKAKQNAKDEMSELANKHGQEEKQLFDNLGKSNKINRYRYHPKQKATGTAANLCVENI